MGIQDFLKRKEAEKVKEGIVKEAEKDHKVRMQSLEVVPPWIQAAREEELEKKKLGKQKEEGGGSVEGSGRLG